MNSVSALRGHVDTKAAREALTVPRCTFYRHFQQDEDSGQNNRRVPSLALSEIEQQEVLDMLHSERFWDCSPYQVYATLLDEGTYLSSIPIKI